MTGNGNVLHVGPAGFKTGWLVASASHTSEVNRDVHDVHMPPTSTSGTDS